MSDSKVIRRRRAALAVFVALSIGMLTVYFGESGGGVLHSVQRGAQEAFAPLETGASRALKPVRDFVGWFGDTFEAKGENEDLRNELAELQEELARVSTDARDAAQLRALVDLGEFSGYPQGTRPVTARVIAKSPTPWYSTLKIDKGSGDGVRVDQPVVAPGGLVGRVSKVTGGNAEITLITDALSGVTAQVMPNGATGVIVPQVGKPDDLLLDYVGRGRRITEGATVVTSGFTSEEVRSLFPRGIPIGKVVRVDPEEVEQFQRVHVEPFADVRHIDYVQVLRRRPPPSEQAGVPIQ